MENWKPIPGYEGYYEVSDRGRIRSVERVVSSSARNGGKRVRPQKVLRQKQRNNGYLSVTLSKEGDVRDQLVHRMVAMAFIDGREKGRGYVNHKNLNKMDNRVCNLEWCSPKENSRHALDNHAARPSSLRKKIMCVETRKVFDSSYQAAEWVNANEKQFSGNIPSMSRRIRACATGATKTAYGYAWKDVVSEPSTTIPKGSTPKRVEMGDPS